MDRKEYWNEKYYQYWKERVDETQAGGGPSTIVQGDTKTEGDEVYIEIFEKYPFHPGTILEVGCAWGRWFDVYKNYNLLISGIDISSEMIRQVRLKWEGDPAIKVLEEAEAETLPFPNNTFDNLACLAVFDATYQDRALGEMLRVTRDKGFIYLTGKNHNYHDHDQMALNAEIGARSKGHPNYFTDVAGMLKQVTRQGHRLRAAYYFPLRGDFACLHHVSEPPEMFYEYFVIFEKNGDSHFFTPFADKYSRTFSRHQVRPDR